MGDAAVFHTDARFLTQATKFDGVLPARLVVEFNKPNLGGFEEVPRLSLQLLL